MMSRFVLSLADNRESILSLDARADDPGASRRARLAQTPLTAALALQLLLERGCAGDGRSASGRSGDADRAAERSNAVGDVLDTGAWPRPGRVEPAAVVRDLELERVVSF